MHGCTGPRIAKRANIAGNLPHVSTVGAKLKFTFRFRTTAVLRYEMSRCVSMDSSVLT